MTMIKVPETSLRQLAYVEGLEREIARLKVERIEVIKIQPDDVIVATILDGLDPEQFDRICEVLRDEFAPNQVICMVGVSVEVHRPGEDLQS
jgi:hypothetical protein